MRINNVPSDFINSRYDLLRSDIFMVNLMAGCSEEMRSFGKIGDAYPAENANGINHFLWGICDIDLQI